MSPTGGSPREAKRPHHFLALSPLFPLLSAQRSPRRPPRRRRFLMPFVSANPCAAALFKSSSSSSSFPGTPCYFPFKFAGQLWDECLSTDVLGVYKLHQQNTAPEPECGEAGAGGEACTFSPCGSESGVCRRTPQPGHWCPTSSTFGVDDANTQENWGWCSCNASSSSSSSSSSATPLKPEGDESEVKPYYMLNAASRLVEDAWTRLCGSCCLIALLFLN